MDTIKNSVSHSAEALLLGSSRRGALGHPGDILNLTFPRLFTFDPLVGLCPSDGLFLKKMCVGACIFVHGVCMCRCV